VANDQERLSFVMQQAEVLQQQLASIQDSMGRTEVTGTAAGGAIAVSMTAAGEFLSVHLEPDLVDESQPDELESLVLAALRDAAAQLRDRAAERTAPLASMIESLRRS
jgi:hypothetical protein